VALPRGVSAGVPREGMSQVSEEMLLGSQPSRAALRRGSLLGEDLVMSWGGLAALVLLAFGAGVWKYRRRRPRNPVSPQVMGRLLENEQELSAGLSPWNPALRSIPQLPLGADLS